MRKFCSVEKIRNWRCFTRDTKPANIKRRLTVNQVHSNYILEVKVYDTVPFVDIVEEIMLINMIGGATINLRCLPLRLRYIYLNAGSN